MVTLKNVKKSYKDFTLDISLEIPNGMVIGLVGQNGAGKSTTIKAITGLTKIDEGEIKIFDKNIKEFKAIDKAGIGVALSDSCFSREFTIKEVIKVLNKMYYDFDKEAFEKECKNKKLPLDKKIGEFSTGMKARLRVLIAMCHNAKLLILDEPTAGLDVVARNQVLDMLRKYMAEDEERAILISSHISSDLEGLCDEIYMIDGGKIILHEDTDKILSEYGIMKVTAAEYEKIDKTYILNSKEESFGYSLLTNQKKFYQENYPNIVIENGDIDELIMMAQGGNNLCQD